MLIETYVQQQHIPYPPVCLDLNGHAKTTLRYFGAILAYTLYVYFVCIHLCCVHTSFILCLKVPIRVLRRKQWRISIDENLKCYYMYYN